MLRDKDKGNADDFSNEPSRHVELWDLCEIHVLAGGGLIEKNFPRRIQTFSEIGGHLLTEVGGNLDTVTRLAWRLSARKMMAASATTAR
jgi:hypothetical protein